MRLMECNQKSVYVIQGGIIGSKIVNVMHYTLTKEIWEKFKNVYEGDGEVKGDKP